MAIQDFDELRVYRDAYDCAMRIFEASRSWPREERYALVDQIRRSSRAICANVAEAWSKRRYEKHFISKLTDADGEASETITWITFAIDCGYLGVDEGSDLVGRLRRVRGGLIKMMSDPEQWCGPAQLAKESEADYRTDGEHIA